MNKLYVIALKKIPHISGTFNELDGGVNLNIRLSEQTSQPGYQVFPGRINR
ncbi:MAG: hypothetical protein H0V30_15350 [Chitinophagaceae bacterium]|nr:hypothetical protein [Chitinophagaceae bacterium]